MPDSFAAAIALERTADHEYTLAIPDGWQQGRGAFGGLVLGAMLDAMVTSEPDTARIARSMTGDLCGPAVVGPARIVVRVLRRGKNQSNLGATLLQGAHGDELVAHATATLAVERRVPPAPTLPLDVPREMLERPYADTPEAPLRPQAPRFTQNYEYRPTGTLPWSGGARAEVTGWVREKIPLERVTAAAMVARLDAHWPATFSVETTIRPVATVAFMAELLKNPRELDPRDPLFYRARVVAQAGGYFVEMRELWKDGEIVALNQQVFAMMG
jgi:hypothetical protein